MIVRVKACSDSLIITTGRTTFQFILANLLSEILNVAVISLIVLSAAQSHSLFWNRMVMVQTAVKEWPCTQLNGCKLQLVFLSPIPAHLSYTIQAVPLSS